MKRFIVDYVDIDGVKDYMCVAAKNKNEAIQEFYNTASQTIGYENAVNNYRVIAVTAR